MKISKEKLIDIIKEELSSAQEAPPAEAETEEIKGLSAVSKALRQLSADVSAGKLRGVTVAEFQLALSILKSVLETAKEGNIVPLRQRITKYVEMGLGTKPKE
jgi:hypothetical protein